MDDIARSVGISRPALYLVFKNKADIFRAVTTRISEQSMSRAQAAARATGFLDRVMLVVDVCVIEPLTLASSTAHGAELIDVNNKLVRDLIVDWKSKLLDCFEKLVIEEIECIDLCPVGLSPSDLAMIIVDGLEGLKMRTSDPAEVRRQATALIRLIALVIDVLGSPRSRRL